MANRYLSFTLPAVLYYAKIWFCQTNVPVTSSVDLPWGLRMKRHKPFRLGVKLHLTVCLRVKLNLEFTTFPWRGKFCANLQFFQLPE